MMKILTLNVQALGGSAKQKSLHRLFASVAPNIILFQEIMNSSYPALLAFSKLCPSWEFCAVSSKGLLGGLLSGWNPRKVKCKAYQTWSGILLKARFRGSKLSLSIINCYGPYIHHESFWDEAARGGLLTLPNLILAGYLNLTLNASKVWSRKSHLDPLGPYFT